MTAAVVLFDCFAACQIPKHSSSESGAPVATCGRLSRRIGKEQMKQIWEAASQRRNRYQQPLAVAVRALLPPGPPPALRLA